MNDAARLFHKVRKQAARLRREMQAEPFPQLKEGSSRDSEEKTQGGHFLKLRKKARETLKRNARGVFLKSRKQACETPKRNTRGLFLKLKKQTRETPKRNARGALPQIKEASP